MVQLCRLLTVTIRDCWVKSKKTWKKHTTTSRRAWTVVRHRWCFLNRSSLRWTKLRVFGIERVTFCARSRPYWSRKLVSRRSRTSCLIQRSSSLILRIIHARSKFCAMTKNWMWQGLMSIWGTCPSILFPRRCVAYSSEIRLPRSTKIIIIRKSLRPIKSSLR